MVLRPVRVAVPDSIADVVVVMWKYKAKFGVYPNVFHPQMFNEKIIRRMLFDHRTLWTRLQDKYQLRSYVKERLGKDILPTLYWVTQEPTDIPFDTLPDRFMVKPTHGSGWIYPVPDKRRLDTAKLIATCQDWMGRNCYHYNHDWIYKHMEPRIVVEEFVDDGTGVFPIDYKFLVFDGRVHVIQVDVGRFGQHRRNFYGRSWNRITGTSEIQNLAREVECPRHFEEMVRYAEMLGAGLDFIRADFYDTDERAYLGELTVSPGAGMDAHEPREFARYLGEPWEIRRRPGRSATGSATP
jgi:hypothetical protein